MALHELATNATKYGAWSVAGGKVLIAWTIEPGATAMHLDWIESGGPPVAAPARQGFHIVLENMVAQSVRGEVRINYDAAGLQWSLSLPIDNLTEKPATATR
jgi:two-component sensor histidine kinase